MTDSSFEFVCPSCRSKTVVEAPRKRTPQEHRTFFGVVGEAFSNWPEDHAFSPENAEHLRAWLLIEAGHFLEMHVGLIDPKDVQLHVQIARFTSGKPYFRVGRSGQGLSFYMPRSLSLASNEDRSVFNDVAQRVYEIIHQIVGVDVDAYVRHGPGASSDPGYSQKGAS